METDTLVLKVTLWSLSVLVGGMLLLSVFDPLESSLLQVQILRININQWWMPFFSAMTMGMVLCLDTRRTILTLRSGSCRMRSPVLDGTLVTCVIIVLSFIASIITFKLAGLSRPDYLLPLLLGVGAIILPILLDPSWDSPTILVVTSALYAVAALFQVSHILLIVGCVVLLPSLIEVELNLRTLRQPQEIPIH